MKTYFAIVHKDAGSTVGVVFPDLPGCFSAGDTYDDAIANAHVALRLYAEAEQEAGRQLPGPRTFEALCRDREVREEARGAPFVGIRLEEHKHGLPTAGAGGASGGVKSKKRARRAG
jgi:predicted RNase H-like HicB family nuclease